MLQIRIATCSERGARATNEDAVAAGECSPGWYAVLADGAGGHCQGAEAARRAVRRLQACLCEATLPWSAEGLTQSVLAAHDDVRRGQQAQQSRERMHATVVVLCVDVQRAFALWSHVGDSRLYRVRQGAIDRITVDDSLVHRLVEARLITPAQALHHPYKHRLAAALGIDELPEPHTERPVPLQEGDAFLLCSDGWWGSLGDDNIVQSLQGAVTPQQWLAAMRTRIEQRRVPDQDNYSAIALWAGPSAG